MSSRDLIFDEMAEWIADLGIEEVLEQADLDEVDVLVKLWEFGLLPRRNELGREEQE